MELAGTGRHLTEVELRAWTGFIDASRMIEEVHGKHLAQEHQMSHRDYEVLVRLDGAGGRMRMSTLARQIVASAPLLTQTIVRLEVRGVVDRRPAESGDGRGVDAVLLPAGRELLGQASGEHADIVKRLLIDRIGERSLPDVAEAMRSVADHLRLHRQGQNCDDDGCPYDRFL